MHASLLRDSPEIIYICICLCIFVRNEDVRGASPPSSKVFKGFKVLGENKQ